ncbi:MAG: transposase [Phycisphaerales bacterium]|nr:transposase [Phycisphaerales bacterium]
MSRRRKSREDDPPWTHLATDVLGRPIAVHLNPGHHRDIRSAETLLASIGVCIRFVADRAYDTGTLRQKLRDSGIRPIIPDRRTEYSRSATTKKAAGNDAASRRSSVASRTADAWPPATTRSPGPLAIPSHSLQPACFGCD